jgi:HAD superfamily hydrolase (TIGR01509 family)
MYLLRGRQYPAEQIQEMMDRKNRYYNDLIKQMTPSEIVPEGRKLLEEIRKVGIKIAIASTSKNCRTVLERLQIVSYFDGIADGYCVVNSKPAADIFVYAAGLLNVHTVDCLGVEDAEAGIEAIKQAGMQALAIGPEERFHDADHVLPTLAHARLQDLLGHT